MQRTAILNGSNVNFDKDYSLPGVAIMTPGVVEGLQVTTNTVAIGKALIQVERTATSPSEVFYIVFENTTPVTIDTSGTKKVFIQIPKANLNDPGYNQASGENIATIQTGASYPTDDFIPLASITAGVITDEREDIMIKQEVEKRGVLLQKGTAVNVISDYTFTGAEENNIGFLVDTSAGDVTLTLDPGLFDITKGLYQFTFTKTTGDSNSLIIDSGSGNTIDGGQTYTISQQWEAVILEVFSDTFMKVISTANKPSAVDIQALAEAEGKYGDYGVIYDGVDNKKIKLEKIQNVLKKYPLASTLPAEEFVRLLNTGKVDKLDIKSMNTVDPFTSFSDGYPFDVFKLDNDHFGVYVGHNASDTYPRVGIYTFDADGNAVATQGYNTLTTSHSCSSNYKSFYSVPMGNNTFVFLMSDNNGYIQAVVSTFNPDTGTLTNGTRYTIDSTSSNRGPMSGARMTDNTLLINYYGNIVRKATINPATRTFTTLGSSFTIPGAGGNTSSNQSQPIAGWGADVGAVCYRKYNNSDWDIFVSKIDCTGHDVAFSEETLVREEGSYDTTIRYGITDHQEFGGTGRKMAWIGVGGYSAQYGKIQVINYDDVNGFEIGNTFDFGYRNTTDYGFWDGDKILVFEYDYDGTGNGRYYSIMDVDGVTVSRDEEVNTSTGTYVLRGCRISGNVVYAQNNESSNHLYIYGKVKNMANFFGILKEGGVLDDMKKVARYGNVSEGHTGLTPGKEFGYGRALTDTEILLFKNT